MILLITFFQRIHSQNILDTSTWTVGSGSVSGFNHYGAAAENTREWGTNPKGNNAILWKIAHDGIFLTNAGWDSDYHNINYNLTYRFTVWIKKTNSDLGDTRFGCKSSQHLYAGALTTNIKKLDGTTETDPYFWSGDLPQLNKWYLLVGYVHHYNYSSTVSLGGIYDSETGAKVESITDYKMQFATANLRHRAYLVHDPATNDKQYFYDPRMEPVNGSEPPINVLLGLVVNQNSELIFTYDVAGNQTERFYCPDNCSSTNKQTKEKETDINEEADHSEENDLGKSITVFPNPTEDFVTIKVESELLEQITSAKIYSSSASLVKSLKTNTQNLQVNLSGLPLGVYFLHIHLNDGSSITKKIIKE